MPQYIKDGRVGEDGWLQLRLDEQGRLPAAPIGRDVIVPLACWLAETDRWLAHGGRVGVCLAPEDDPALLGTHLADLVLIAIDFPAFTDGRGYSLARLLRERYDYAGELRAVGDVWPDLIRPLWQVGFDAFVIKDGKALDGGDCYNTFSDSYQMTYRQPIPLFRRRVT
ncbi:DUF934 domain-containing protein [Chromobacterium sphagni]|uniref:Oxidoreductase n=1 Tax=Chromobacterium sphagni TaxID=1903179 RepID=A0A1S1X1M3_9NEIS|nr:DUF934 domain-containing protein [Chromobacterium sphagni]OHX13076.1 hypothetical protein BI347_05775 [Chromobacterium sphagni]OHX19347.1 hypothetical protein BI344_09515 [Chromobacterium sphagni]